jgi:beta-barrel assembly-enhancing protease
MRRTILLVMAGVLLLASAGCVANPVTGKSQLDLMGESQELELGRSLYSPYIQQSLGPIDDPDLQAYVRRVGESLAAVSHRPGLPYDFTAVNDPMPNAFALPGGKICITRGLLSRLESEDGMAAVVGHEIGHVTSRHAVSAYNRQILAGLIVLGAGVYASSSDNDAAPLVGLGAMIGSQMVLAKYSRDDERQSDELGLEYGVKAGFSPRGMIETQKVLLSLQQKAPGMVDRMFASHPMSAERLATAEKRVAEMPPDVRDRPLKSEPYRRTAGQVIADRPAWDLVVEGQTLLGGKKPKEGEAKLAEAARKAPSAGVIRTLHAIGLYRAKQGEAAVAEAREGARLAGGVFVPRLVAGELLVKPAPAEALTNLDAAEKILPGIADVAFLRGRACEALGRRQEAVDAYREAVSRDPQGEVGTAASGRLRALGAA